MRQSTMSGLLERIARRRASASRRLGPRASRNGTAPPWDGAEPAVGSALAPHEIPVAAPGGAPLASEDAPPAPEEAPAAPPQPVPEPTEPSPAPVEPPAAPPEPSPADPSPAEPPPAEFPDEPPPPAAPTFLERGQVRRRARYLRRVRELQLRDISGFVLELHRFRRERRDLLKAKLDDAARTDRELRALERALGERLPVRELREAGIGGACSNCGAVYGSADHYCARCGNALSRGA